MQIWFGLVVRVTSAYFFLCFLIFVLAFVYTSSPTALWSVAFAAVIHSLHVLPFPDISARSLLHFPHIYHIIVLVGHWCCHNPSWSENYWVRSSGYIPQAIGDKTGGYDISADSTSVFPICDLSINSSCSRLTFRHPRLQRQSLVTAAYTHVHGRQCGV